MNNLSMHILDIVQNSIRAEASNIELLVHEDIDNDRLIIKVSDNGKGMTPEQVKKLKDPFFTSRTTRRVGLGIPLLTQTAEQTGGSVVVTSELGKGTITKAVFSYSNIDRPPMGPLGNSVTLLATANPEINFTFIYKFKSLEYRFNNLQVSEILGEISINSPSIFKYINEMISENINMLKTT
ncbi:MAG: ATP-binding protein [Bacteroidales bacterium]